MRKIDLAYLAGIIDGEGCIRAYPQKSRKQNLLRYNIRIEIMMVDKEALELAQALYGGKIYIRKPRKEGYKTQWRWSITGERAYKVLIELKTYMLIKRTQAELAIRIVKSHPKWKHYTPMERFLQELDAENLSRLKT